MWAFHWVVSVCLLLIDLGRGLYGLFGRPLSGGLPTGGLIALSELPAFCLIGYTVHEVFAFCLLIACNRFDIRLDRLD